MKIQSLFRCAIVATMLTMCTFFAEAGNINCEWGGSYGPSVEWKKEMGCWHFRIRYYDYSGLDNHIEDAILYWGTSPICMMTSYQQNDGINPVCRVKMMAAFGRLYVKSVNGWKNIPRGPNWDWAPYTTANGWYDEPFTGTSGAHYADIYWFPDDDRHMTGEQSFRLIAVVKNSGTGKWNHDKSTTCKGGIYEYKPTIKAVAWTSDGAPSLSGSLTYGDAYTYTRSTVILQSSPDGTNWYDRQTQTITNKTSIPAVSSMQLLSYKSNSTPMSQQQFANGVYFRFKTSTTPDYGSSPYFQDQTSASVKTEPVAVIKDRALSIVQNNRDLVLNWSTLQPSGNSSAQLRGNFIVQKYNASTKQWDNISTVNWDMYKKNYTYTYTLSDDEVNKGEVDYKFRVWRDVNRWTIEQYSEFMSTKETTLHVYTDYKKVMITSVSPVKEETKAIVQWDLVGQGIWDNKVSLTLRAGSQTLSPGYNATSYTIGSLASCSSYSIEMEEKVGGATYYTTPSSTLNMPNLNKRSITNLQVSKGYYSDNVMISWDVPAAESDFDYFSITRTAVETGNSMTLAQVTHSGLTSYSYQDKAIDPGTLYTYRVDGYSSCGTTTSLGYSVSDIGFSQPYATVSGRIAFNGDQSVPGVTVSVTGGEDAAESYSVYFENSASSDSSALVLPAEALNFVNNPSYTIQMWMRADKQYTSTPYIFGKQSTFDLQLSTISGSDDTNPRIYFAGKNYVSSEVIPVDTWTHLTLSISVDLSAATAACRLYINGEVTDTFNLTGINAGNIKKYKDTNFVIGGNYRRARGFRGYLDELRIWNTKLTDEEIAENYDRLLSGREQYLNSYYRFDENGVSRAFDVSGRKGVYNRHDGTLTCGATHSLCVPSAKQLANKTITDEDGNYIINTVPYTADGVQYNVTPTMGIHSFSPNKRPIFASPASIVFNNIDFEDVSSFPVSGHVYYEGTDYPVEGAYLYVDGTICSSDGQAITTKADGSFTVQVPIGDHSLTVKMNGHTFAVDGRYPADPENLGLKHTFDQEVTGLEFYDQTKMVVVGRVSGGQVEREWPMGMGLSKNNIGMAEIQLTTGYSMNNPEHYVNPQPAATRDYENASQDVNGTAYCPAGTIANEVIYLTTDSLSGEFAVLLPPVDYTVKKVKIINNDEIAFTNLSNIEAPLSLGIMQTDSITLDDGTHLSFDYDKKVEYTYRTNPNLQVTDRSNKVGAFGEKTYAFSDILGDTIVDLYTVDSLGNVTYTYGYPVFVEKNSYSFDLRVFELYANYDDPSHVVYDSVPLQSSVVTFANTMSSGQRVYVEDGVTESGKTVHAGDIVDDEDVDSDDLAADQVALDSLGYGIYGWQAGMPNIIAPYTRSLNIVYTNEGKEEQWEQNGLFNGIVFGQLPTGNDFVTSGPDKLLMVLRDPPGTGSSAFWEAGTSTETETTFGSGFVTETSGKFTVKAGIGTRTIEGTPGFGVIDDLSAKYQTEYGLKVNAEVVDSKTYTTTIETTKRVSTSEDFDYVGAPGDVFVGQATNIIIGDVREVGLHRDTTNNIVLDMQTATAANVSFGTLFYFTQNDIENSVLPNLEKSRNALFEATVASAVRDSFINTRYEPIYLTSLMPDDPRYGSNNNDSAVWADQAVSADAIQGPSYRMVLPESADEGAQFQDMVRWYNLQIQTWKKVLADNEHAKIQCIAKRDSFLIENVSFSAGAAVESSQKVETAANKTHEWTVDILVQFAVRAGTSVHDDHWGLAFELETETGARLTGSSSSTSTSSTEIGYSLQEEGDDDRLTVDIFDYQDGFGPIFVTRAGRTSCPYEGQVMSKYQVEMGYETEEKEISAATMQIEVPSISAVNPYATDVPAGSAATYTLLCSNLSETGEDCYFDISPVDAYNQNGARICLDGLELTANSRTLLVPANTTITKIFTLEQTLKDVLKYDSIPVVLSSTCQNDPTGIHTPIADTVWLFAEFVPACSPVSLEIENRTLNTFTSDTLSLVIKDYDVSYTSLRSLRLQYKYLGDVSWTTAREYVVYPEDKTDNNYLIPSGGRIYVNYPMSSAIFPDGTYEFRVVSNCVYGSSSMAEDIDSQSETIQVIKDMSRPQVLGTPSPSTGILASGDDISVTFNEDIRTGSLSEANFSVTGVLNGAPVAHATAMALDSVACAASTSADIRLAESSWTLETWIRRSSDGTLYSHGTAANRFNVSIDKMGHLVVDIEGSVFTSDNVIPADKWCYLAVAYSYDTQCYLDALVASDASTVTLFDAQLVPAYSGTGKLQIGKNIRGAMHELTLWNTARSEAQILSEMYQTKAAGTNHLIGYWRLDEGHGTAARDVARSRNLTLAADTWYIQQQNKAAHFNGAAYVDMPFATISADDDDDYLVELWFRGRSQTNAVLWSAGQLAMGFNAAGDLTVFNGAAETPVTGVTCLDNAWHHLALNVLRNGTASVYLDGQTVKQMPATDIPAVQGAYLTLGAHRTFAEGAYSYSRYFAGDMDEVRYWVASRSLSAITDNMYAMVDPSAVGLRAYYPMQAESVDAAKQTVISFSLADASDYAAGVAPAVSVKEASSAPAVRSAESVSRLSYNFVASDRTIVISLTDPAARLEATTVSVTVRDVRDANNNLSLPVTWTAFVNRNVLAWSDDAVSLRQSNLESTDFTVSISNLGGTSQQWVLSGVPAWLSASETQGQLSPLSSRDITFTVSSATPIGYYEATIYLYGTDNIYVPLTVTLRVTGEEPEWTVNPADFENSMNIIGQLRFQNMFSYDENDVVAAFIGDQCVATASPRYYSRYDAYYVVMDVYGNADQAGLPVRFRAYDASTGIIYPVVATSADLTFAANTLVGSIAVPFVWNAEDKVEQSVALQRGWNWASYGVSTQDNDVEAIFASLGDNIAVAKGKTEFSTHTATGWHGEISELYLGQMYKLHMNEAATWRIEGQAVDPELQPVTVRQGYNWLGVNTTWSMTTAEAFAGLDPVNGDYVKGQEGFAMWAGYEWVGTLTAIAPGRGYIYYSASDELRSFSYPSSSMPNAVPMRAPKAVATTYRPVASTVYPGNMTVVARVMGAGATPQAGIEVGIFAGNECREAAVSDAEGYLFLTIPGDGQAVLLTVKAIVNGEERILSKTFTYQEDQMLGTYDAPVLLYLDKEDALSDVSAEQSSVYKIIDDNRVIIVTPTGRYTVLGCPAGE